MSLTGGIVEDLPLRAAASPVEGGHGHQVRVATHAVVGAVVAGGVAGLLGAVAFVDKGLVAVGMRRRVPSQRAVSFS